MSHDTKPRRVEPIDEYVSARVYERRNEIGMLQHVVASAIGVTHQQYQKYEAGKNRMSAARLYEISLALGVPMTYFFEGIDLIHEPTWDASAIELAELEAADLESGELESAEVAAE